MTARRLARHITEAEFQRAVIQTAHLFGWRVHHSRPSQRSRDGGWETAIQGDKGLPDLIMARRARVVFAELKRETGTLTQDQAAWLAELGWDRNVEDRQAVDPKANPEVYLWRPSHMAEIVEILR